EPFADRGDGSSSRSHFVRRAPRKQSLANKCQFLPVHVLEGKLVPEAENFAIDTVARLEMFIGNGEIVHQGKPLLFHHVFHRERVCDDRNGPAITSLGRLWNGASAETILIR